MSIHTHTAQQEQDNGMPRCLNCGAQYPLSMGARSCLHCGNSAPHSAATARAKALRMPRATRKHRKHGRRS